VSPNDADAPPRYGIDLNADVGESFGAWRIGEDEQLIPLLTSANIACGAHAGDPLTIERTVRVAVEAGVAVGAHPGYPDLAGFGRRDLAMAPEDLAASIVAQVGVVAAFATDAGVEIHHVKAHGALYNAAARDPELASVVASAIARVAPGTRVYALPGSALLAAATAAGLRPVAEGFPDRAYEPDGSLRARSHPDAVLTDSARIAERAVAMAREGRVVAVDGTTVSIAVQTLCLHGDTPGATEHALAVRDALTTAGIDVRAVA
jgi:UPF0271 protein